MEKEHVHRVLVVDDSRSMRQLVADLLEAQGYETLVGSDGAAGLEKAQASEPCLALVDIRMPVLDGPGFVQACRRDRRLRHLPIVLLSMERDGAWAPGLARNVDRLIPKPFHVSELLDGVAAALGDASVVEEPAPAVLS